MRDKLIWVMSVRDMSLRDVSVRDKSGYPQNSFDRVSITALGLVSDFVCVLVWSLS